jgi:hypothetical protein
MKRSRSVTLTIVAAIAAASCSRRPPDPCDNSSWDSHACEDAVRDRGYYYNGAWYPRSYAYPYSYYSSQYGTYAQRGEAHSASSGTFARPSSGGVVRGGFGSTGAGHGGQGSGGGGE